jgi:cytochrome c peroxidase
MTWNLAVGTPAPTSRRYPPGARGLWLALVATAAVVSVAQAGEAPLRLPLGLPVGLWERLIPSVNPVTAEKIELGRRLYYDRRLSSDGTIACATCHDPEKGFADGRKVAEGIGGKRGARNSPTVLNAIFNEFQFWDGRAQSLEEQAKGPLINPVEMGMKDHDAVVAVVQRDATYAADFLRVFGRKASIDDIVAAIATFERTVVSGDSAFDRFSAGDPTALSPSAQRGLDLWNGKARCSTCHSIGPLTPNFTDNKFHNIGVAKGLNLRALSSRAAPSGTTSAPLSDAEISELGRFVVDRQSTSIGAFRTPGLRDVALTAPYMHDGSKATLMEVVAFYQTGGELNPYLDVEMKPVELTGRDMSDLVAFMESLTGEGEGAANRQALRDSRR